MLLDTHDWEKGTDDPGVGSGLKQRLGLPSTNGVFPLRN